MWQISSFRCWRQHLLPNSEANRVYKHGSLFPLWSKTLGLGRQSHTYWWKKGKLCPKFHLTVDLIFFLHLILLPFRSTGSLRDDFRGVQWNQIEFSVSPYEYLWKEKWNYYDRWQLCSFWGMISWKSCEITSMINNVHKVLKMLWNYLKST